MKRVLLFTVILLTAVAVFAQQRYALVIGNNNYNSVRRLDNPVNDATDIAAKLRNLGFQVDLQTNVTNVAMARSITNFVQRLSQNRDNEGFFWFAGHAVQINGENYLLPVDVDSSNEVEAVHSSYAVKRLVDSLDQIARNKVNVVVLDACRDNPFVNMPGSFRNVTRGLSVVQNLPSDLLIIYSTAAGAVAQDGSGQRNSPFTQAFLQSMDSTEDIQIVFRTIARETMRLTNNNQRPFHDGSFLNLDFYSLNPRRAERPAPDNMVRINGGTFTMGSPANEPGRSDDEIQHQVTVSSFYMGKYEVTQKEWYDVMGTTVRQQRDKADKSLSLYGEGDNYPMYYVSWFDAVEYCNKRSQREGLTPAYTISGTTVRIRDGILEQIIETTVTWNRNANGYRLPTEAEWEYACRAGTTTAYNTGANISDSTGWYGANSGRTSHPVGQKPANRWGLYDIHGNVWEWCWDWYGSYSSGAQTDPMGASSGSARVLRGGGWMDSVEWVNSAASVRSAVRGNASPSWSWSSSFGFRLVCPIN